MEFDPAIFIELFAHTLQYWWVILPAIFLGLVVGAIPGFSAANTIIILLPLAITLPVEIGFVFMIALYASSRMGAGAPAILVNIPGTAGAAATPLDGYPMTRQGRGPQALAISFTCSTIGGLLTTIIALVALPWLSEVAFYLHSVEMIVVMLFGISLIATIAARDTLKGLIAGFFGLMIGSIGSAFVYETPRGTFGFLELYDGVPLIPALVGLFAISEAFAVIERDSILTERGRVAMKTTSWAATMEGVRLALSRWWHIIWTSLIGLVIGVVPGAGAAIAAFVAYQQSRTFSKTPELYGTGHLDGLVAPESANNGVTSGTLVPLLVIGIPGGATAAIMLVVLQYHGVTMGTDLFMQNPELAYLPFAAMAVTYFLMLFTIIPLARYMSRITVVRTVYMSPLVISFTLVGAFVPREYLFDMYLALVFGVIGYIARKTGYHVAAILIGVILGPLMEGFFIRAMKMSQGDVMVLFSSKLGNILWLCLVANLALPYIVDYRRKRKARAA
ncbi:MAG TPA: tripartite tricarboxylate transporter permease [Alphaproteobacteria bacterium]|nr:tripartite tricarboxylate transporter permease [Alphaproteobacteria bacterium]